MTSSTTRSRRGRPPGREGAELLAVARELFIAQGFRGTTMDAVAAAARISKQSLYAAYPSKDDLFAAVVRGWVDRGYDAMRPHSDALAAAADVRLGLKHLAAVMQAGILSPDVLAIRRLVAAEADRFPEVAADYVTRSWDRNVKQLARALATLDARGLLDVAEPDLAADQLVWLVVGGALNRLSLHVGGRPPSGRQLSTVADEAVETFLRRYGPPTTT